MTQELHPALDRLLLWTKMHILAVLSIAYAIVLSGLALVVLGRGYALESMFSVPSSWLVIIGAVLHVGMAMARVEFVLIPRDQSLREHFLCSASLCTFLYGVGTVVVLLTIKGSVFLGVVLGATASIYWLRVLDGIWNT